MNKPSKENKGLLQSLSEDFKGASKDQREELGFIIGNGLGGLLLRWRLRRGGFSKSEAFFASSVIIWLSSINFYVKRISRKG